MNDASMKDVATRAGVSTATVSHVINNSCNVREETKDKVNRAIKDLNYRVNPTARKLRNGHSKVIGFVVSNLAHYFYMELGNAIEAVLNENGYELFYINSNEDPEKEKAQLEMCRLENFAGIIVVPVNNNWKNLEPIISNIPTVFIDRKPNSIDRDVVLTTNKQSGFDLTCKMIEKGATNIAFIAPQHDDTMQLRVDGFKDAMKHSNLEYDPECIIFGNKRPKIYGELAKDSDWIKILDYVINEKHVDCIISGNDLFAFGAISYFNKHNITIQKDILFGTFDDTFWMNNLNTEIYSVAQNKKGMGEKAAKLLLDRLNNEDYEYDEYCIEASILTLNKE